MMKKFTLLLLAFIVLVFQNTIAQTVTMGNGPTVTSCAVTLLDPGGAGNYPNNSYSLQTICSSNGDCLKIEWNSFNLENLFGFDYLNIYNGTNTFGGTLAFFLSGNTLPATMTSNTGCVTFEFSSDASNNFAGFSANISCVSCPPSYGDCDNYLNICTNTVGFNITPNGFGQVNEIPQAGTAASNPNVNPASSNSGCLLAGELNSTWMLVTVTSSGMLEFSIGGGASTPGCLDWIMYPYSGPATCTAIANGTQPPVRCNWNGACMGITGISDAQSLPSNGSPFDFEPPLPVTAGQQFMIVLSNYSSQSVAIPMNFFTDPGNASVSCQPYSMSYDSTNVSCFGGSDGSIVINVIGGTPPFTYTWNPNVSTDTMATNLPAGAYTVTVNDSDGTTITATINIGQPTQIAINTTVTDASCFGGGNGAIQAVVTGGTPAYTYTWSGSSFTTANATNLSAGSYNLTVTDANNCVMTQNNILVGEAPPMNLQTFSTIDSCGKFTGTASVIVTGGTPGYTYSWNPTSLTDSLITGLHMGNYKVTVTDFNGCKDSSSVFVPDSPIPTAGFVISPENPSLFEPLVTFTESSSLDVVSWNWYFGSEGTDVGQEVYYSFTSEGVYPITLIVTNQYGCKDTAYGEVTVNPAFYIYIPNAFTPDEDGLNDQWFINGIGIDKENFSVRIYSRWGNLVYASEDPNFKWNGGYGNNGKPIKSDAYVYSINLRDVMGKEYSYKGNLSLMK
jgi:gliding motility-associated-like protein